MHKRIATLWCALVLVAGVPLALGAQVSTPLTSTTYDASALGTPQSFTYQIGQGISTFKTDLDKSFNVTDFSTVDLSSLSFADFSSLSNLNAGYAMKLANLFLGFGYSGNFAKLTGSSSNGYTTTDVVDSSETLLSSYQATTATDNSSLSNSNRLGVLVGFGNIGVSASVYENINTATGKYTYAPITGTYTGSQSDTVTPNGSGTTTSTIYTPDTNGSTNWAPVLSAGALLQLGDLVLKPSLSLGVNLHDACSNAQWDTYTQVSGSGLATYSGVTEVSSYASNSYNSDEHYYTGIGKAGATLTAGNWVFGAIYQFESPFYSSSYTDTDGKTAKTVAGQAFTQLTTTYSATLTTTNTVVDNGTWVAPTSEYLHTITPSIQYSAPIVDKVLGAIKFVPQFQIDNYSQSSTWNEVKTTTATDSVNPLNHLTDYTAVTTYTNYNSSVSQSTFSLSPALYGALQVAIIDKVLNLNIGANVQFENLSLTTTTSTTPGYNSSSTMTTYGDGTTSTTSTTSMGNTPRTDSSSTTWSLSSVTERLEWGLDWTVANGITLGTLFNASSNNLEDNTFTIQLTIKK
jgi:hypothetical protein